MRWKRAPGGSVSRSSFRPTMRKAIPRRSGNTSRNISETSTFACTGGLRRNSRASCVSAGGLAMAKHRANDAVESTVNPYPGPRPFELRDAESFFGREREASVQRLWLLVLPWQRGARRRRRSPDRPEPHSLCRFIPLCAPAGGIDAALLRQGGLGFGFGEYLRLSPIPPPAAPSAGDSLAERLGPAGVPTFCLRGGRAGRDGPPCQGAVALFSIHPVFAKTFSDPDSKGDSA